MGYDARAYVYYGVELDQETTFEDEDKFPLHTEEDRRELFAITSMGNGSCGETYRYLILQRSIETVMEDNWDHIEHPLGITDLLVDHARDIDDFLENYSLFIENNALKLAPHAKPGWYVGCYGS